jgi:hypothetical protein
MKLMELSILDRALERIQNHIKTSRKNKNALSLIRSSKLIHQIHEVVKTWIDNFHPITIRPELNATKPEKNLDGYFKKKKQDIFATFTNDQQLCVNVRSQLSSICKNFDTIFERTCAEVLNIRLRHPDMICCEVMMYPIRGMSATNTNDLLFTEKYNITQLYQKYNKLLVEYKENDKPWQYHAFAIILVDFETTPPQFVENYDIFKEKCPEESLEKELFDRMSITQFIHTLSQRLQSSQ